jgi:pantoate--beta-alanine ligase
MVIKKLLALTKVENIISIDIAPIIREPDGLAMSSRNKRLSPKERVDAPAISKVLGFIKEKLKAGNNDAIIREATNKLESSGFKVDYICVADAETLMPVNLWDGKRKVVALVAAFLGGVRLIDNLIIN